VEAYPSEPSVSKWYTDVISVEEEDSVVAYNLGWCYWARVGLWLWGNPVACTIV